MPAGYRPIVVDNGSTDGTADVARAHGAVVVDEPVRGFGAACCRRPVAAATADVVCFMDADGSLDPRHLELVAAPVVEGWTDLVLGARRPERRAWPVHARAGQLGAGHGGAAPHRHPPCRTWARCERPAGRRCWRSASPIGDPAGRSRWCCGRPGAGWRIDEVPVPYAPRIGRSKVTGTVRGTVQAVRDMRRVLADLAPIGPRAR